jgi:CAAX prenyl protease-like protein
VHDRGYLMRRLVSPGFRAVPMRQWHLPAILVSSVLFGFLHGERWFAGMLAGLVYASLAVRRGRVGEAVVGHMTTNAFLAAYVIYFKRWGLW